jgi:steroid delta-isomerase-like uncharacterized protein
MGGIFMMSLEANKALVRRYYHEVLNRHQWAVLDELFASNFTARASNYPDVNFDQFKQALKMSRAAFPDLRVTIEDQIAADDKVVTRWTARATHTKDFAGIPATGKPVFLTAIHIHRIENRRMVELWEEINLLNLIKPDGNLVELMEKPVKTGD